MRQIQSSKRTGLALLVSSIFAAGACLVGGLKIASEIGRAIDTSPQFHYVRGLKTGVWHCRWAKDNDGDGHTDVYVEWKDKGDVPRRPRWSGEVAGYPPGEGELEYPRQEQIIAYDVRR